MGCANSKSQGGLAAVKQQGKLGNAQGSPQGGPGDQKNGTGHSKPCKHVRDSAQLASGSNDGKQRGSETIASPPLIAEHDVCVQGSLTGSHMAGSTSMGDMRASQSGNSTLSQMPRAQAVAVAAGKSEDRASSRSSGGTRNIMSTRSSFAVDSDAAGLGPAAGRNRRTFEQLRGLPSASGSAVAPLGASGSVKAALKRLVVVPNDTPVPAAMLQRLWKMSTLEDTLALVQLLQTQGFLRVAQLDDGSTWCLVASNTLQQLQAVYGADAQAIHGELLDMYTCGTTGSGAVQLRDVPDDGYIMQNMGHHLVGAGRLNALRTLLGEPAWLESKLHAYGTAPVVSDFRRYLAEVPDDMGARLLLQALQLSLGCCAEHPGVHMLREQMLARLMMVVQEQQQHQQHQSKASGGSAAAGQAEDGTVANEGANSTNPPSRMCTAASAVSSVGATPHHQPDSAASRDLESTVSGLIAPPLPSSLSAGPAVSIRDSARISGVTGILREWFEYQSSRAAMDIVTAAGYACVHLMPRNASLKQAGGVERMILRGHKGPIKKVVISPNGQDVVTVSEDGSAQVWDMNVGDCVMQLARQQPLSDVDVAPGGCLCVVASVDGAACVWDMSTGAVKHVLRGHTSKINSVVIDRHGSACVTASDDRSVRVWSIDKGQCKAVLAGHGKQVGTSIEFGLAFDVALSADGDMAATASEDFTARVWDLETYKCLHVLEGHSGWVVSVRFIGESTHLVTASHDGTARIWDGLRGKCLHVLTGHTGRLNRVIVDTTGAFAVTCSDDGTARVWEIESGTCRSVLQRHEAWVADAAITRGGTRCVTVGGDGLVCVWNAQTGELQACLEGHSDALRSVVLTGGGRFAVSAGDDGTACVWDLAMRFNEATAKHQHSSRVRALQPLAAGHQVVSSCDSGLVVVWDVASCKPVASMTDAVGNAAPFLGVAQDGSAVVCGCANRHVMRWGLPDAQLLGSLPSQQGSRVKHMAFNAAATHMAMVLYDSTTSVWDLTTGTLVAQLMGRGERVGRNVHTGGVNGVLLAGKGPEGRPTSAVTWSKDCSARVWDIATSQVRLILEGHTEGIRCAALSADEVILATASYGLCVRLHMLDDGSPLAVLDHASPATNLSFSPDGRLLAVVLENHTVVIWDLVAHNCLAPLQAHKSDIMGIAFSPDSLMLATCSQDCTTRVWDAHAGREIALFVSDAGLTQCCFAGGMPGAADILVVGDAGGATHFLDLPPELQPGNAPMYYSHVPGPRHAASQAPPKHLHVAAVVQVGHALSTQHVSCTRQACAARDELSCWCGSLGPIAWWPGTAHHISCRHAYPGARRSNLCFIEQQRGTHQHLAAVLHHVLARCLVALPALGPSSWLLSTFWPRSRQLAGAATAETVRSEGACPPTFRRQDFSTP